MRCRKVRSLLSAASFDELGARQQAAVREHTAGCPSCRKEASYYASIKQAVGELPGRGLSDDFNTRLLNRIAEERFAETRTKAYLPKPAPRFAWRLLAPVTATVALLAVAVVSMYSPSERPSHPFVSTTSAQPGHIDDSYLTVQPLHNPNMTVGLNGAWSLDQQMARAEKLERISSQLTNRYGFGNMHLAGSRSSRPQGFPGVIIFPQPTNHIYQINGGTNGGEDNQAY